MEKGERVYLCKKLNIDILSSYPVYGHNLTFRYPGQPHTCILCHRRGHGASECPNIPDNRQLRHPARDGNNTESAQGNNENQQVDNSYAGKTKSGTISSSASTNYKRPYSWSGASSARSSSALGRTLNLGSRWAFFF